VSAPARRPSVQRQQAHPRWRQQRDRIEVVGTAPQAPVQAGGRRAAGVAGDQRSDRGATRDCLPCPDRRIHRLVRRPQPTGVVDAHHRPARHHSGEGHDAVAGGQHRAARRPREVDAAVPGAVPARQHVERPGDGQGGQGSGPPRRAGRCGGLGQRTGRREQPDQRGQQDDEGSGHPLTVPPRQPAGHRRSASVDSRDGCGERARRRVCWAPRSVSTDRLRASPIRSASGSVATSVPARGLCGAAGRQGGHHPVRRDNRGARPWPRVAERLQWQSSA
jgi:hypothetical protein